LIHRLPVYRGTSEAALKQLALLLHDGCSVGFPVKPLTQH